MLAVTIVYMAYGGPALFIYFLVLATIWNMRRQLSRSFVHIYMVNVVVDTVTYINSFPTYRLRSDAAFSSWYYFMNEQDELRNIQWFSIGVSNYVSHACAFLFTLNRFSAIVVPTRHARLWSRPQIPICVTLAVAVLICMSRLPVRMLYNFDPSSEVWLIKYTTPNATASLIQTIYGATVMFINMAMNILALRALIRLQHTKAVRQSKNDLALFYISLFIFFAQVLNVACVLAQAFFPGNPRVQYVVTLSVPYAFDMFALGPAIYTLIFAKSIRHRAFAYVMSMARFVCCVKTQPTSAKLTAKAWGSKNGQIEVSGTSEANTHALI